MTGFGVGTSGKGKDKINVEIKSLNSRFLEIKLKGIVPELGFEEEIRKILEKSIVRGNLLVKIEFNSETNVNKLIFDKERYESIQGILKSIYIKYGHRLNISDIITANDLIKIDEKSELNYKLCMVALQEAIENLNQMRKSEGKNIKVDILDRLKKLYILLDKIDKSLTEALIKCRTRMPSQHTHRAYRAHVWPMGARGAAPLDPRPNGPLFSSTLGIPRGF